MRDIHTLTPETELIILRDYLNQWITKQWPLPRMPFKKYIRKNYPQLVHGTPQYAKLHAIRCFYCNRKFGSPGIKGMKGASQKKTFDHFYPVSKVQDIAPFRQIMVVCCSECNGAKADRHPHEWLQRLTVAQMNGLPFSGIRGSVLNEVIYRVNKIFYDEQMGKQKKLYWVEK